MLKERMVCLLLALFVLFVLLCNFQGATPATTRTETSVLKLPLPLVPVPAPAPGPPQVIVDILCFYEEEDMALIAIRFGSITKAIKLEVGQEVIGEAWYQGQVMRFWLRLDKGGVVHLEREGELKRDILKEIKVFQL